MFSNNNKIVLRGLIFKEKNNNKYYAISLTTNHISTGTSSSEAAQKLFEQIGTYLKWVHDQKQSDLTIKDIRRPAPFLFWNKYIFARILFIFSQIAGFGIDTVQMLNPEVDKHQAIISPA